MSPSAGTQAQASAGSSTFITCLPLRVMATTSSSGTMKPCPDVAATSSLRPGSCTKISTKSWFSSRSTIRRTGSPWPRPPGSWSAASVKTLPLEASSSSLSVVCALTARLRPSPCLNSSLDKSSMCPFMARIQPFSDRMTVIGSFSIIACSRSISMSGASANDERRAAERGLLGIGLPRRLHLVGDALPLQLVGFQQRLEIAPLLAELVVLGLDLDLFEPRQGLQAQVEDGLGLHVGELEAGDQLGLRLVLEADDADDLVEVEVGDQVAVEHLEAVLDLLAGGTASAAPAPPGGARATA